LKTKFLVVILFMFLGGCATTANYEKALDTWVGKDLDSLVVAWGPPAGTFQLSDGSTLVEYVEERNAQVGGYSYTVPETTYQTGSVYTNNGVSGVYTGTSTSYVQHTTPRTNVHLLCKTRFKVDAEGIIRDWSWSGNNCVAYPPD
jgi:hypothetical protein